MATPSIDIKRLKKSIGKAVQVVGNGLLSSMGRTTAKEPSVILSRGEGPYPKYPYAVVDYINQEDPRGWGLDSQVTDDGTIVHIDTNRMMFRVSVLSRRDEQEAASIANHIRNCFMLLPNISDIIKEFSGGALLEYAYSIQNFSITDRQGFLHSYGFNLTLDVPYNLVEPNPHFIDTINAGIRLLDHEDDEDPMTININENIYP